MAVTAGDTTGNCPKWSRDIWIGNMWRCVRSRAIDNTWKGKGDLDRLVCSEVDCQRGLSKQSAEAVQGTSIFVY